MCGGVRIPAYRVSVEYFMMGWIGWDSLPILHCTIRWVIYV